MNCKEHLTEEGLQKIIAIKSSMNWGLSNELKLAFPNIIPVERPVVQVPKIIDPNWLVGFVEGEGCFYVHIIKSKTCKLGKSVCLKFFITQHSRDTQLMKSLIDYLGCGKYVERIGQNAGDFIVQKFSDITLKIIPLLKLYPLEGSKRFNFIDFCKVANLMEKKVHLTQEGLDQILLIKAGMNRGRNPSNISQSDKDFESGIR